MKREEYMVKEEEIARQPTHPGVLFAEEVLPNLGRRTIGEIATLLGVSRQTLHRVMAGQIAVSPEMAVRLGQLCGNGPTLWSNMQASYDTWVAAQKLGKAAIKKIPTLVQK